MENNMNRRELGRVIGGAALTAASYRRVLGANGRIGVALVGAGRRGTEVMGRFLESGRVDLRAICDIYDVQRQRAKEKLVKSGEAPFECVAHKDVLSRNDVDAVYLAVPDHLHVDMAREALAKHKHVYLEKPTTHTFDEQHTLRAAARQSDKVLQCGTQQRSGAHYIRAKEEIVAKGKLGKVAIVRASWSGFPWQQQKVEPSPQPPNLDWDRFLGKLPKRPYEAVRYQSWRYFPDYGGGLLADILTHWADVAQWMMDDAYPLTAETSGGIYYYHDGRENPDTVNSILQYKGGWNLTFESSVLSIRDERPSVVFLGTDGTLDIARSGYIFTPHKGQPQVVKPSGNLDLAHVNNFLDAIQTGKQVNAPAEIGIQACNPVHLAKAAYWQQQRMKWEMLS
jgi:predicted dehydrogenase